MLAQDSLLRLRAVVSLAVYRSWWGGGGGGGASSSVFCTSISSSSSFVGSIVLATWIVSPAWGVRTHHHQRQHDP